MNCIELTNVSKHFGKKIVIDNVSYCFECGKIYGLVGNNGCGKSVLFKMISGLMKTTHGEIKVLETEVCKQGSMPIDIGILIETPGFLPDMTGFQNLKELASIRNIIGNKEIENILRVVSLYESKDTKVKNYSLGMLQRLGVAQALMEKPKILLLDEPFNSMDENGISELRQVIKNYVIENNATILITSHNKDDIDALADKIIILKNGTFDSIFDNKSTDK